MKIIWKAIADQKWNTGAKRTVFLFLHTALWIIFPLVVCFLVGALIGSLGSAWLLTSIIITGYAGMIAFWGGIIYLMRNPYE